MLHNLLYQNIILKPVEYYITAKDQLIVKSDDIQYELYSNSLVILTNLDGRSKAVYRSLGSNARRTSIFNYDTRFAGSDWLGRVLYSDKARTKLFDNVGVKVSSPIRDGINIGMNYGYQAIFSKEEKGNNQITFWHIDSKGSASSPLRSLQIQNFNGNRYNLAFTAIRDQYSKSIFGLLRTGSLVTGNIPPNKYTLYAVIGQKDAVFLSELLPYSTESGRKISLSQLITNAIPISEKYSIIECQRWAPGDVIINSDTTCDIFLMRNSDALCHKIYSFRRNGARASGQLAFDSKKHVLFVRESSSVITMLTIRDELM